MDIQFLASIAPIVRDDVAASDFYQGALGLSFEGGEGDYKFTERLPGSKHFGLWPLAWGGSHGVLRDGRLAR
jgi:hypothetical protein